MITVFVRTLIVYIILIVSIRLMGKRQIGELQLSELVTTFMLSELAVIPIADKHIPVAYAVLPILLLLSLEVIISFVLTKSAKLKRLFLGYPSILIRHGKLNTQELGRLRITAHELLAELRQKNVGDIGDVEYAILEDNGKLSVFPKAEKSPLTPQQMQLSPDEEGVAHALIVDGEVNRMDLHLSGYDEDWLTARLAERNLLRRDVFLFTVNDAGTILVILSEKQKKKKGGKNK